MREPAYSKIILIRSGVLREIDGVRSYFYHDNFIVHLVLK